MILRRTCIAAVTAAMVMTGAAVANATVVFVDDGTWNYGTTWTEVWSHYYHPYFNHGSTARGSYNVDSGCVGPNSWSYAAAGKQWYETGHSYYRQC